jgi:hypothetical protein
VGPVGGVFTFDAEGANTLMMREGLLIRRVNDVAGKTVANVRFEVLDRCRTFCCCRLSMERRCASTAAYRCRSFWTGGTKTRRQNAKRLSALHRQGSTSSEQAESLAGRIVSITTDVMVRYRRRRAAIQARTCWAHPLKPVRLAGSRVNVAATVVGLAGGDEIFLDVEYPMPTMRPGPDTLTRDAMGLLLKY